MDEISNFMLYLEVYPPLITLIFVHMSLFTQGRIDEKKASRLRNCLNSEDVVGLLLCEQIPAKRPGKGYHCRVCQVPLKGHVCPYCPVCSTSNTRFEKNDSHVCKNCIKCYDLGKKRKKLVQFSKQTCPCKESEVHGTKNQVSAS